MNNKMIAVITGVAGQDGSYLAEYLLEKGYKVIGISRRKSVEPGIVNLEDLFQNENFTFLEGDITDATFISRVLHEYRPHEYYNLAAMSVHPKMKLPLKRSGHGVRYSTIEQLWKEYSKNNEIKVEAVNTEGGRIDCEVININYKKDSNATKALGYKAGMGVWKPIKQISRHFYKGTLVRLKQKWGEVIVTPNHSLYNSYGELVMPTTNPELFPVRKINYLSRTYKDNISLSLNIKDKLEKDGDWINILGKNNKVKINISNNDGSLNAFLRFCGAYISEGWLYQKNKKRYSVFICQNDKSWLENLQKDLSFFYSGKSWISKDKNGCHVLEISSKIMYFLMKKYCGTLSENKHMPDFIFDLNIENKNNLLKTLLEGDGSFDHNHHWSNEKITQTSEELALQLSLLFTENNWDYTIDIKDFEDKNWKRQYTIRRTRIYQFGSGNKVYEEIPYEGWVYDISVDEVSNFTCGFGNILVHNSHVGQSFKEPASTFKVNAEAVVTQLELIRQITPYTRFYQASTSELFGGLNCPPEGFNESSPFHPRSPYAVAKMAAYWAVVNYREAYGLYACNGILFNHSSPRRGLDFATRKITRGAARTRYGLQKNISMGNLAAFRDEGHSKDYVRAMHLMLQQSEAEEFIIATGQGATIEDMFRYIANKAGFEFEELYEMNPNFMRPSDVAYLLGDASKAREKLSWRPEYTWKTLLDEMYEYDIELCKKELGQI